jgi:predicted RNase H-like HicB family nuclease
MASREAKRYGPSPILAPGQSGQNNRFRPQWRRYANRHFEGDNETDWSEAMKYAVLYEQGPTSVGVTVPDLPGCFAVAKDMDQARKLAAEAIAFHIEGLRESGQPVPEPSTRCEYAETLAGV